MQIVRIPAVLVFELVQPVMFVLLFVYVFAGNIDRSAEWVLGGYAMFLMPGIIVQNAIFGSTTTAIGIAEDLKAGLVDRFRSLPMARSAMLAGRATSDLVKNFVLLLVVIGIGYLVGFSFEDGLPQRARDDRARDGRQLHVLVGDGRDRPVGQEAGGCAGRCVHGHLPARVHELGARAVEGMEGWVQVIARNNPISHWANLARVLHGRPVLDERRLHRGIDRDLRPCGSSGSSRCSCRSRSGCTRSSPREQTRHAGRCQLGRRERTTRCRCSDSRVTTLARRSPSCSRCASRSRWRCSTTPSSTSPSRRSSESSGRRSPTCNGSSTATSSRSRHCSSRAASSETATDASGCSSPASRSSRSPRSGAACRDPAAS